VSFTISACWPTRLKSAQTYYFRFRAFTREGWQDYSQVVSLLVH